MTPPHSVRSAVLCVLAALVGSVGCASRATEVSLPLETPQLFSDSGTAVVADRWWESFDDGRLQELVDEALSSNLDLQTAWYRLREAEAIAGRESAPLWPSLDAEGVAELRRPDGQEEGDLGLGLVAQYEIDLWGRIRSAVDAERFRAEASAADFHSTALTLSAEVVRTWCQWAEARAQSDLLSKQVETNEQVLRLIRARFGSGRVRSVDILRQRQLTEATREQKILVETEREILRHRLAVLLGRAPRQPLGLEPDSLPALPPLPETGLPAELVRRRPDVQRAFLRLRAADADLAAAISNQYPRLSLTASLSTSNDGAATLFDDWVRSLAANLIAPLFDGGERDAEVDRTRALQNQRLYEYGQATLVAFQEVEDALIGERKQRERIDSLERQAELSGQAYRQLRLEYLNGVGDYIDVLTALDEDQRLRRELVAARLTLLERRIDLYRALAGGFMTDHEMNRARAS